jgi:hypothetical protein
MPIQRDRSWSPSSAPGWWIMPVRRYSAGLENTYLPPPMPGPSGESGVRLIQLQFSASLEAA